METNQSVTLLLSQEELLLILMRYRLPLILGMNPELTGLTPEQLDLLMGAAERSLLAREFLEVGPDGKPELDQTVLALSAACSQPEKVVVMIRTLASQKNETLTVNFARQLVVVHVPMETGVHQFTALPDKNAVPGLLQASLSFEEPALHVIYRGTISEATYRKARELAPTNKAEAAGVLEGFGPMAGEFAATLADLNSDATFFSITNPAGGGQPEGGFSLLQGGSLPWLLTFHGEGENRTLEVQPATNEALQRSIKNLL